MDYVCKVGTPTGEIVEQTFVASDEGSLRATLDQQGYYLFAIRKGLTLGRLDFRGRRRVRPERLLFFCQELAALLKAGLPLLQALEITLERQPDPVFRRSLSTIRDRVRSGAALSDAFLAEEDLYPPILAASLVAGERSGSLETVLRRLAQYLRLSQTLKKKAISASVYPVLLLSVMLALVVVLLVFVIPSFQEFFDGLEIELPLVTRFLIALGTGIAENLTPILVALVAAAAGLTLWWRQRDSGELRDRWLLKLPYLGPLARIYAISQLTRTLSTLLSGGLPLVNALDVAASSVGNRSIANAVRGCTGNIREGKSLTTALESSGAMDSLTLEMVKVGEQTGALAEMLSSVAEFYDEELDNRMATLLALVEPVLLVLMAFIVAGMLLAFYLPLFQAVSATIGSR
jgi:type IV pilus assembly protein PilC